MEKHAWKQVRTTSAPSLKPSSRWGHSCCVIDDEIIFFGGYADSNYMNDLWAFNATTMEWRLVETTGDIPIQRSNCSMNYDKENQQIIIFGGGGANKQRFNSISILDWNTKKWIQITPKENENAPWERTYHSAEYINSYLIVFGGEGPADLDDLWVFDFKNLSWTEVKIPAGKPRPCARRFHSSVSIGNTFYVIAGCHGKYRCLSDVFAIDITDLIKTGRFDNLEWEEKKLKNTSFLTRWGHSSAVFNKKIYIFGGRFSNDLNDTLVADVEAGTIRQIKTLSEAPQARRRHCAGFIGSNMLVFGGFNGQYFQDLNYISMNETKSKFDVPSKIQSTETQLRKAINNKHFADCSIQLRNGAPFYIHQGMLKCWFSGAQQIFDFIEGLSGKYSQEELTETMLELYQGYGELKMLDQSDKHKLQEVASTRSERLKKAREQIDENTHKNPFVRAANSSSHIIKLKAEEFEEYMFESRKESLNGCGIQLGGNTFYVNKVKMAVSSPYFSRAFMTKSSKNISFQQPIQLSSILNSVDPLVFQIALNFIETDIVVLPDVVSEETLMSLLTVGDYLCMEKLVQICCNELTAMIKNHNVEKIMAFSSQFKYLTDLTVNCCDYWIKMRSETLKICALKLESENKFQSNKTLTQALKTVLQRINFDLIQYAMEKESASLKVNPFLKKKGTNSEMEKENLQSNAY